MPTFKIDASDWGRWNKEEETRKSKVEDEEEEKEQ
jgi:hypothetical protein